MRGGCRPRSSVPGAAEHSAAGLCCGSSRCLDSWRTPPRSLRDKAQHGEPFSPRTRGQRAQVHRVQRGWPAALHGLLSEQGGAKRPAGRANVGWRGRGRKGRLTMDATHPIPPRPAAAPRPRSGRRHSPASRGRRLPVCWSRIRAHAQLPGRATWHDEWLRAPLARRVERRKQPAIVCGVVVAGCQSVIRLTASLHCVHRRPPPSDPVLVAVNAPASLQGSRPGCDIRAGGQRSTRGWVEVEKDHEEERED